MATEIKSDAFELDLLKYVFTDTPIPTFMVSASTQGIYLHLFKSDPRSITGLLPAVDAPGSLEPTTAEYASYAHLSVGRTAAEWLCATAVGVSTATKDTSDAVFAVAGGGSSGCTVTWAGVSMDEDPSSGSGKYLLYAWALDTPLSVTAGIAPRINVGDGVAEER